KGEAKQISTAFEGEAKRAIDGNTNGQYFEAKSTTHTAPGKDPWWEVDLKSTQMIDRLVVWNRTDGVGERLANFKLLILNDQHEPVWSNDVAAPPNPSTELSVSGRRAISFVRALADYSQSGFD